MKKNGMKGMSLLVMLGFVLSVLTVFAPAGAADGRAGSFVLNVSFSDEMGGTTNSTHAYTMVNITANISLDSGQENITDLKVTAYANDEMVGAVQSLGELAQGQFEDCTWQWMPLEYGDYTIKVTAQNGTDAATLTEKIVYFRSLASNITIASVTLTAQSALIGVDEITITAALVNTGNAPGTANVTFGIGEDVPLGFVEQDVPAGGNANAIFMTNFAGYNITDGSYVAGAMLFDWELSIMMAPENVTLTNPAAKLAVDSLLSSAASAIEGTNVTLTARLNNSGTANAVNLTVDFMDGTAVVHSETNISVDLGQVKDVSYIWVLPDVTADTNKTITAKLGDSMASVNVTIVARVAKINITDFTVPEARIGDVKNLTATVKNEGNGDANGVVVEFYDGTTKLVSSAPFNLSAGSSTVVSLAVTMAGTADANHTFFVKAAGAEKNSTRMIGHKLAPASVVITSFTVAPAKKDKQPQDSTQSFTLTVVLKNSGELKSTNCTLTIKEGTKAILLAPESIALDGNGTVTKTYTWKVKGSGSHTATASLTGADAAAGATKTAKCTLEYTPGFEVLFLVAAIIVAAILVRRRQK